ISRTALGKYFWAASRMDGCSIAETQTSPGASRKLLWNRALFASVAPEVHTMSRGEQFRNSAALCLALSSAASARLPSRCGLAGLPGYRSHAANHASRAAAQRGEVSLWSK